MNILHATTNPSLTARLKEMLGSSSRADITVGYFFISGFEPVEKPMGLRDRGAALDATQAPSVF